MKRRCLLLLVMLIVFFPLAAQKKKKQETGYGTVKFVFTNLVNGRPLVLHDSLYTNQWNEQYTVTKLKYYISNIVLRAKGKWVKEKDRYHLVNQADTPSVTFSFNIPGNNYDSLSFLPGVDSARNCSGAQTGALDPLNDMFWTWNSGYVMEKIEGISPQSNFINNKIEYHIGGYRGIDHVLNYINLAFPEGKTLSVQNGKTSIIKIEADLDKLWRGKMDLKISETPACSSPGQLAKNIAANFAGIFTISDIINPN